MATHFFICLLHFIQIRLINQYEPRHTLLFLNTNSSFTCQPELEGLTFIKITCIIYNFKVCAAFHGLKLRARLIFKWVSGGRIVYTTISKFYWNVETRLILKRCFNN